MYAVCLFCHCSQKTFSGKILNHGTVLIQFHIILFYSYPKCYCSPSQHSTLCVTYSMFAALHNKALWCFIL